MVAVVEPLKRSQWSRISKSLKIFELRIQKRLKQSVFTTQFLEGILGHVDGCFLVSLTLFKLLGLVESHGDKLRQQRVILLAVQVLANSCDVCFEEFAAALSGWQRAGLPGP